MKELPPEPTRLAATEPGNAGSIEALASALVRNLAAPPSPRPADLARIRERVRLAAVGELPPRRAWAGGVFLLAAGGLAISCWVVVGALRSPTATATATEDIHLFDGQTLQLSTSVAGRRLAFAGPAEATREGEVGIRMDHGHGVIAAGARPIEVWTRGLHVSFAAYAQGAVDGTPAWTRVSALAGDVTIGTSTGRTETLAPGSLWEDGALPETAKGPTVDVTSMIGAPELGVKVEEPMPRRHPRGRADRERDEPEVAEARWLGRVLRTMRVDHDPAGALQMLEGYERRFPDHRLQSEVVLARVESSLALGRKAEALALLESGPATSASQGPQPALVRGELRAGAGRCADAVGDFDTVLRSGRSDSMSERALYGRAICHRTVGQSEKARRDFAEYLHRFPTGGHAASARAYLNGS
jgi:hypothetical protein